MAKGKQAFKADEIVVCIEAFGTGAFLGQPVFAPGTRFRGDNPVVKNSPQYFVRDGTPTDEIALMRTRLIQEAEADVPEHRASDPQVPTVMAKPVRDEDAVISIRGRDAGTRYHHRDRLVTEDPSGFVAVVPDSKFSRANALVALETLVRHGEDGTTRTLHKGQWTSRSDPFVVMHPTMFAMPRLEED